jgi:pimeloyl-ACP methyl ester carboxylesterase
MRGIWQSVVGLRGLIPLLLLVSCGGSSGSDREIPQPAITVAVEPAATTVQAGATIELTASLRNDASHVGVAWSISPPSGAGALADPTDTSVTYIAPSDPPEADLTVTITATSRDNESKSDSANITVSAIFVAIEPAGATVEAGGSQAFTASVQQDPSQAGVTWAISPASGAGSLIDVTSTSATYEAPSSPPPDDLYVTITATPVANDAISASAAITVPAILVQLAPGSALMPAGATQALVATVTGDRLANGVEWTLTQGAHDCSPACGSLANVDSMNATFAAPSVVPAETLVTLTARSVTDPAKFSAAAIELSTGTVQIAPAELDFGPVKVIYQSTKGTVLTNAGSTALTISGITIEGADADDFSAEHDCGNHVAAGASCQIDVTFSPGLGSSAALLSIVDSSTDSPQQISLSGSGASITSRPAVSTVLKEARLLAAPAPTGPERVGTRTIDLTDSARDDPYRPDGKKRELPVRLWYPASVGRHCRPAPYMEPAVWNYASGLLGFSLPVVRTNSCLDARPADGAHPIVVFTHGYTGTLTDYTFLFEDLASRGYVVASIGHTYESTAVSFGDGRLVTSVLGSHLTTPRMDRQTLAFVESVRLTDVRFVIDELARLNSQRSSPFAGHFDLASVAVAGHSFGGLTALQAQARDPRIRAVVVIDCVMPDKSFALTDTPVLILDAGRERWSRDQTELWRKLNGRRFAVNLNGAEHVAPSDLAWLARSAIDTGRMTPEQAVAATREVVAAFFEASLRGSPVDSVLIGRSARFPGIEVRGQAY